MIPPGGEVKTSVLNDLIELLLISRAMYGGISIFIVAISIFFLFLFWCFVLQLFFKGDRWYK